MEFSLCKKFVQLTNRTIVAFGDFGDFRPNSIYVLRQKSQVPTIKNLKKMKCFLFFSEFILVGHCERAETLAKTKNTAD